MFNFHQQRPCFPLTSIPFFDVFVLPREFNHTLLQVFNSNPPITIEFKSEITLNEP